MNKVDMIREAAAKIAKEKTALLRQVVESRMKGNKLWVRKDQDKSILQKDKEIT